MCKKSYSDNDPADAGRDDSERRALLRAQAEEIAQS